MNYTFHDGNGNGYFITKKEGKIYLEYKPVKPLYSSSGTYDGGDPVKKEIEKQQYDKIASILNEAARNLGEHIKNRVKGSGLIKIGENKRFILKRNSQELDKIKKLLKSIR
ncbi:MAG: hypothetical protein BAJALOKI1v1_2510005 [Promethearchaeota archaeon]|nr:MAG: hypothetical protein BAJALOKI1v1_2510005 [Candidatus Lokiarchaeota archaeon]